MKILALGSQYLIGSFRKSGISVCAIVPPNMVSHKDDIPFEYYGNISTCSDFISSVIESFQPDLIFQGDHSGPLIHTGIEKYSIPKVWYSVDVHLHHNWHKHFAVVFDKVFCAQSNYISFMSEFTSDVEWLPVFCLGAYTDFIPWEKREHFISFVGTMNIKTNPQRIELFEQIKKSGIDVVIANGRCEPVYSNSKIVINQSVADDLNLRFFEATGCGALLITDRLTHSMNEILVPDEDYLIYEHGDSKDLIDKINWVRAHDSEAAEMASRAQSKILKNHLEIHRAVKVLEWYQRCGGSGKVKDQGTVLSHLAWTFDFCSRLTIPDSVTEFFKSKAQEFALQAQTFASGKDRANLILAERDFQNGLYNNAFELLCNITHDVEDWEFIKRYYLLRITIEYLCGHKENALQMLNHAFTQFPDDTDLLQIKQVFYKTNSQISNS